MAAFGRLFHFQRTVFAGEVVSPGSINGPLGRSQTRIAGKSQRSSRRLQECFADQPVVGLLGHELEFGCERIREAMSGACLLTGGLRTKSKFE